MQEPERDWVVEEGEALLATNPKLAASIDRQLAEDRAGKLKTVDTSTVRQMLEKHVPGTKRS